MIKKLFAATIFLVAALSVEAIPAYPVKRIISIDDNTQLTVTLRGDEHFHFYESGDGRLFRERLDGSFQELSAQEVKSYWTERVKVQNIRRSQHAKARAAKIGEAKGSLTGTKRGLVILAEFDDLTFVTENPNAVFKNFFNQKGYDGFGMNGSVRDYFQAQSYGQFDLQFDVIGPVKLPGTMGYYGAPTDDSNDVHPAVMARDACRAVADSVNFSAYDWDGDGEVDQVFIVYAGYGQAQGGTANTIWPHEWALAGEGLMLSLDGVKIDTYACSCELKGNSGKELDGIGTACHEFTHCLGLPDMYDTGGNNYAMGHWDVMCAGSYNNESRTPAGYTAYERMFAGWLEPVELNSMTRVSNMKPLAEAPEAYIMYNDANPDEYYLLENRQPINFDSALGGHGLLVVHVDYDKETWSSNNVNMIESRQRMTIIPADNRSTLNSENGDPFPGTRGVTELTNYTTPAATLYNNNVDGTKLMSKPIDNITEDVAAKTVSFVVCRPELGVPVFDGETANEGEKAFIVTWQPIDGAIGYQLELTEIGSAATDPSEALLRKFDFSGCVSKSNGFTDISSKLANYGLANWSGSKLYTSPNKLKIGTSTSTGYITTPSWWAVPSSLEITFVMGADIVTSKVEGSLKFETAINGGSTSSIVTVQQSFEVAGNGLQVFSFTVPKQNDLFRLTIQPSSQMYLNYLAIYDGIWMADQLGISTARTQTPHYANTAPQYFESATNSYTFTGLNTRNRYIYRVRAVGEENTYSQWSEEKTFSFSPAGIDNVMLDALCPTDKVYNLQGRQVGNSPDILPKGIYVIGGKKVVK